MSGSVGNSLGQVSACVVALVRQQLEEHGLVVWFDGEEVYAALVSEALFPGVRIEKYDGSFFALRARVEDLLRGPEAPRLLVYVPVADGATHHALCELTTAGAVIGPGKPSAATNTRLGVMVRKALAGTMRADAIERIVRQVDTGKHDLADADRIAARSALGQGTLALVFGGGEPSEMVLRFLADPSVDQTLEQKGAVEDLGALIEQVTGRKSERAGALSVVREQLERYVLLTEFAAHVGEARLEGSGRRYATSEAERAACMHLARTWRNRVELRESYAAAANRVETQLDLRRLKVPLEPLQRCDTFEVIDTWLFTAAVRQITSSAATEVVGLAEARSSGFWARHDGTWAERWGLLAAIGRVRDRAATVLRTLTGQTTVESLVQAYTDGSEALCELDRWHRHMESRFHRYGPDSAEGHENVESALAAARRDYADASEALARRFVRSLADAGFHVPGLRKQRDTFDRHVKPSLAAGKRVAYLLIDGLRFEMAREIAAGLDGTCRYALHPVLGTLPSITEVGMTALLPGAERSVALVRDSKERVLVHVDGQAVDGRKGRMDVLKRAAPAFADLRLEALLPPSKKTRESLRSVQLACVTGTEELDGLCEAGNVPMARRLLDDVLLQARRGIRWLLELGFDEVLVTADHGFLFGDAQDDSARIAPPRGETWDLHRRVWVGRGGEASDAYLRLRAADVGLDGEFEVAVPWGIGCFRAKGAATAYFHGGASPQELIVPVLTVSRAADRETGVDQLQWYVQPGSRRVSTRFLSVVVGGSSPGLFEVGPRTVRVELLDGKQSIAQTVAASYGLDEATGEIVMRPGADQKTMETNTVTLLLRTKPTAGTVKLQIVDAATDRVLATADDIENATLDF